MVFLIICVTHLCYSSARIFLFEQNPVEGSWEDPTLEKLHLFCEESRRLNDWVPEISLPER